MTEQAVVAAIAMLWELDERFMWASFAEGERIGAMIDGNYHPIEDREFVLMYCNYGVI